MLNLCLTVYNTFSTHLTEPAFPSLKIERSHVQFVVRCYFHYHSNFNITSCKQTVGTLIRRHIVWRLILQGSPLFAYMYVVPQKDHQACMVYQIGSIIFYIVFYKYTLVYITYLEINLIVCLRYSLCKIIPTVYVNVFISLS